MSQPRPPYDPVGYRLPTVGKISGAETKSAHPGETNCKEGMTERDWSASLRLHPDLRRSKLWPSSSDWYCDSPGMRNLAEGNTRAQYPLSADSYNQSQHGEAQMREQRQVTSSAEFCSSSLLRAVFPTRACC